jgi:hypothetical protein
MEIHIFEHVFCSVTYLGRCNCCWSSPAQTLLVPSPAGHMATFYSHWIICVSHWHWLSFTVNTHVIETITAKQLSHCSNTIIYSACEKLRQTTVVHLNEIHWARNRTASRSTDTFGSTYCYIRYHAVQSEITFPCNFINVQQAEKCFKGSCSHASICISFLWETQ